MNRRRRMGCLVLAVIAMGGAAGCSTRDPARLRRDTGVDWTAKIRQETRKILEAHPRGLALTDALRIARERNGELALRRLDEAVARIDRQTSVGAFLPNVGVSYQTQRLSEPPQRRFGGQTMTFSDSSIRESSASIVQPIFTPNAWLLVASADHAQSARRHVRERATQILDARVAQAFYDACAAEDRFAASGDRLRQAEQTHHDVSALERRGYGAGSDRLTAEAMLESARADRNMADRFRKEAMARLLQLLDLWPLAEPALVRPDSGALTASPGHPDGFRGELTPAAIAARPLENWLMEALLNRPDLYAADRNVQLRKNEILRALTLFLPELYGYANYYSTSDSYTVNQQYWATGLRATLSLFSGFRNLQAYRTAGREGERAERQRELAAMSVCLEVLEAWRQAQDLDEAARAAAAHCAAATLRAEERHAAWNAGQATTADWLAARADQSRAQAVALSAEYRRALGLYVFASSLGLNVEPEGKNHASKP